MQKAILAILLLLTILSIASVLMGSSFLERSFSVVKNGLITQDMNSDGRIDYRETWIDGELLKMEQDTNHDGHFDATNYFSQGVAERAEYDTDHDGQIDYREIWDSQGKQHISVLIDGRFKPLETTEKKR